MYIYIYVLTLSAFYIKCEILYNNSMRHFFKMFVCVCVCVCVCEFVTGLFTQVTQKENFREKGDCGIASMNTVFHVSKSLKVLHIKGQKIGKSFWQQ